MIAHSNLLTIQGKKTGQVEFLYREDQDFVRQVEGREAKTVGVEWKKALEVQVDHAKAKYHKMEEVVNYHCYPNGT